MHRNPRRARSVIRGPDLGFNPSSGQRGTSDLEEEHFAGRLQNELVSGRVELRKKKKPARHRATAVFQRNVRLRVARATGMSVVLQDPRPTDAVLSLALGR